MALPLKNIISLDLCPNYCYFKNVRPTPSHSYVNNVAPAWRQGGGGWKTYRLILYVQEVVLFSNLYKMGKYFIDI